MSPLRWVWLIAALLGAAVPMGHFIAHFLTHGLSLSGLVAAWMESPAGAGLAWDLLISGIVLIVWIAAEVRVRRNWEALWAVPATLCIGVSCGLPLYLFLRTRPVT